MAAHTCAAPPSRQNPRCPLLKARTMCWPRLFHNVQNCYPPVPERNGHDRHQHQLHITFSGPHLSPILFVPQQTLSQTFLRRQHIIPDTRPPPHDGLPIDTTIHGPLLLVPVAHPLSEVDLTNCNCTAAAAVTHDSDDDTMWVSSDGSSGNIGHAAAVTIFLPGVHTYVLVQTLPLPTSAGAEVRGACMALKLS